MASQSNFESEFEIMLDNYGINVSERTRRLIRRNHVKQIQKQIQNKKDIQETSETSELSENQLWKTIKLFFLFCKNVICLVFKCLLWFLVLILWLSIWLLKIVFEIYIGIIIVYVVMEYSKRIVL
jgi:hypothetical protein